MVSTTSNMDNTDQDQRWLHADADLLSHDGIRYQVTYLGCVEVLASMKALDFENRTKVARDSIRLVCTASGFQMKERRKSGDTNSGPSLIDSQANLTHHRIRAELIINTEALTLKRVSSSQNLCSHRMEGISFASAGEHDTKDYIAYVAKDNTSGRACHVLLCQENESLDVITTIGQAFELRYNEYIKAQQANDQHEFTKSLPTESIPRAKFDDNQTEFISSSNNNSQPSTASKWKSMKSSDIYQEKWFHGKISREEAEILSSYAGDFLVRESTKISGQFILSGRTKTHHKHLLLIDPDGVIRTKDYEFDSIQHLIAYHQSGNVPIVSADSELLLETAILRRN